MWTPLFAEGVYQEEVIMKTDLGLRQVVETELACDPQIDARKTAVTAKN